MFRKRDDGDSAFALVINQGKFQFVVRLVSGKLITVSAPATSDTWTHVAATYDGSMLRLYLDGAEVDYVETLEGSGFKFNNPHVKSTCGCGSSFSA